MSRLSTIPKSQSLNTEEECAKSNQIKNLSPQVVLLCTNRVDFIMRIY